MTDDSTRILLVLSGQSKGHRIEWAGDGQKKILTLGRDPSNDLVFLDDHISAFHAEFRVDANKNLSFKDLGSTNGAMIRRGQHLLPVTAHTATLINPEDRVLLGDSKKPIVIRLFTSLSEESRHEDSRVVSITHMGQLGDMEGRLSTDHQRMRLLYQGTKRLNRSVQLSEVLEVGVELLFELLAPATHVTIMLETETRGAKKKAAPFVPLIARRRDGVAEPARRTSRWLRKRMEEERAALLISNTPNELGSSRSLQGVAIDSMIAVPLFAEEQLIGIVQIDRRASTSISSITEVFTQSDLEGAVVVSSNLALSIHNARLYQRLRKAQEVLSSENQFLKERDAEVSNKMISASKEMKKVFSLIDKVRDTNVSVCVIGETGTGKELVARSIHYRSNRRDKLIITQNCAALPDDLLESELFGHVRGAFTGAETSKKGLFESADGGTIFLDEIGETTPALQSKLLRVLQEGEIRPVGSMTTRRVDVRVISATNRNLEEEVAEGRFREDLYYRLNVFPIHLPPLRDRQTDIPLLAEHFMQKFAPELNRSPIPFSPSALDVMSTYKWPGNIRELQNEVQRLLICGVEGAFVISNDLSARIRSTERLLRSAGDDGSGHLKQRLQAVERYMLIEALRAHDNNKTRTAKTLGITREGLHKKLARHGIS